jgi:hypothetical protein
MRKILFFILCLAFISPCYADFGDLQTLGGNNSDGTYHHRVDSDGNLHPGKTDSVTLGTSALPYDAIYVDEVHSGDEGVVDLPIMSFVLSTPGDLTTSSQPGLESDNGIPSIVWADGETTAIQRTFRIPEDYESDGNFRIVASNGSLASSGTNYIGWGIYVNTAGSSWASVYNGSLTSAEVTGDSTPDEVTLLSSTEDALFSAGAIVTLVLQRDDTNANGTRNADMELYSVQFYYKK